jgi:serine/threonine-protein kinase
MSAPTPGALSPGQNFHGRYEIVRCLNAGGMGAVYECVHLKTRKHRALKVILPQVLAHAGVRDRFELEARVTADIDSEHVVETFDAGVDEATGAPFLVMELLRGEDLGAILEARGPLPAGEIVVLLAQAALALDKTHAAGIIHRDLKPDNLYVTARDDGSPRLKILDFGIAKVIAGNQSAHQTATLGTPLYMSPEQILGEGTIGPGADLYALAHIAFALLTGEAYWMDELQAWPAMFTFLGKVMLGATEPATARAARRGVRLPPAFDAWFARATARSAGDRFDSAATLVQALAVVLGASAPRLSAAPGVITGAHGASAPLGSAQTLLAGPASGSDPLGAAARSDPAGSLAERSRGSRSAASTTRRAVMGLGVLGVACVGVVAVVLLRPTEPATVVPLPVVSAAASAPIAVAGDTASTSIPVVTPEPSAKPSAAPTTPGSAPTATGRRIAPVKTAQVKAPPPAKGCDPPYEVDSAGHHHMKPQCL